jgi:RNA polymerase sigma-70 factor, ECF subfamily
VQRTAGQTWGEWVDEHAARLLLFARQQVRAGGDAEDLLQEAIVESWRRQGDGEPPPLPLVYATIRRRAIDRARSDERRRRREEVACKEDEPWFAPDVCAPDEARGLESALRRLPGEQREVLTMKIWGDMTFREIADALDISINTAASRYRYGLGALRGGLAEWR